MAQKRKLQVFVSSTFTDLKEERQAAVEAILTTGHIPAGMELFAGKNEDQMNIIKEWIDDSDIYMLLLGGRYGSVEPESGKSYTHLEYEYAQLQKKPVFVVVASDEYITQKVKVNENGADGIMELDYRKEYTDFKNDITGRYVKHWNNKDQLQLAITTTLNALEKDENLIGWIPGSEATNSGAIAEELARLAKENAELRSQLSQSSKKFSTHTTISFDDMYMLLTKNGLDYTDLKESYTNCFNEVARIFNDEKASVLHVFWTWSKFVTNKIYDPYDDFSKHIVNELDASGIIHERAETRNYSDQHVLTNVGKDFLVQLDIERNTSGAKKVIDELIKLNNNDYISDAFLPHQ